MLGRIWDLADKHYYIFVAQPDVKFQWKIVSQEEKILAYERYYLKDYDMTITDILGKGKLSQTKRWIENYTYTKNKLSRYYMCKQLIKLFVTQTNVANIIVSEYNEGEGKDVLTAKKLKNGSLKEIFDAFSEIPLITKEEYDEIKNKEEYNRTNDECKYMDKFWWLKCIDFDNQPSDYVMSINEFEWII